MLSAECYDRRQFLVAAACAMAAPLMARASNSPTRTAMGIASNAWDVHFKARKADPLDFLSQCHELGLGGIQFPLGVRDADYCTKLRTQAEQWGMYIEGSIVLLASRAIETFEQQLLTAKASGATVVRSVAFPGRRYEVFTSAEGFERASKHALESLQNIEPILEKHQMRLALENHKDQRIGERLDLIKKLSSQWIGMCVDLGNSFALCEDPLEVVRAYAPYAYSVHIKDQASREYPDGFLFADMPLGKGILDLAAMVKLLRSAHPEVKFNYEVITRDPLRVPVLTGKYWSSMPSAPASDLARTLHIVRSNVPGEPFAKISAMPTDRQTRLELDSLNASITYAREHLQL